MEGTFNVKELRRDFTGKPQSVHYSKPADSGQVTELQPDFEVKSVVERESYDMIYKSGYVECLNHLEKYIKETRGIDWDFTEWIDQQRTTLNKYL